MENIAANINFFAWSIVDSFVYTTIIWIIYLAIKNIWCFFTRRHPFGVVVLAYLAVSTVLTLWIKDVIQILTTSSLDSALYAQLINHTNTNLIIEQSHAQYHPNLFSLLVLLIYTISSIYHQIHFFRDFRRLGKICRLAKQKSFHQVANLTAVVTKSMNKLNKHKLPFIKLIEEKAGPLTVSFLKPIIIYPIATLNNLTVEEASSLLIHELTHIKYLDFYFSLYVKIVKVVMSFNPWIALWIKDIELYQEINCDCTVLKHHDRQDYLQALVKVADFNRIKIATNAQSMLRQRVEYMYDSKLLKRKDPFLKPFIFIALSLLMLVSQPYILPHQEQPVSQTILSANLSQPSLFFPRQTQSLSLVDLRHFEIEAPKEFKKTKTESVIMEKEKNLQKPQIKQIIANKVTNQSLETKSSKNILNDRFQFLNVRNLKLESKEATTIKNFIIESMQWILNHKYFTPNHVDFESFTPEEFAEILSSHETDVNSNKTLVKQQVQQITSADELLQLASNVKKKMIYLLYLESIDQMIENEEIQ